MLIIIIVLPCNDKPVSVSVSVSVSGAAACHHEIAGGKRRRHMCIMMDISASHEISFGSHGDKDPSSCRQHRLHSQRNGARPYARLEIASAVALDGVLWKIAGGDSCRTYLGTFV